jgi:hypothetical protein
MNQAAILRLITVYWDTISAPHRVAERFLSHVGACTVDKSVQKERPTDRLQSASTNEQRN